MKYKAIKDMDKLKWLLLSEKKPNVHRTTTWHSRKNKIMDTANDRSIGRGAEVKEDK